MNGGDDGFRRLFDSVQDACESRSALPVSSRCDLAKLSSLARSQREETGSADRDSQASWTESKSLRNPSSPPFMGPLSEGASKPRWAATTAWQWRQRKSGSPK